ncbi:hypothetical protein SEPCBS57363_001469 [Sporothrix epigloea]|uniref:Uncharacterized protein n=1 Tax=Sporothrix epigloea TaxID=1892477 RepID=A0ABP0DAH3_9PEZI
MHATVRQLSAAAVLEPTDDVKAFAADWGRAFYIDRQSKWRRSRSDSEDARRQNGAATTGAHKPRALGAVMTELFQLKDTKTFSSSMYAWRPLADFEACFGPGVFALLPAGIEKKAAMLARPLGARRRQGPFGKNPGPCDEERSLPWLLKELKRRNPSLQEVCDKADKMLITPLLQTGRIAATRAAELYAQKRVREARWLPLTQRLDPPLDPVDMRPREPPISAPDSLPFFGPPYHFEDVELNGMDVANRADEVEDVDSAYDTDDVVDEDDLEFDEF